MKKSGHIVTKMNKKKTTGYLSCIYRRILKQKLRLHTEHYFCPITTIIFSSFNMTTDTTSFSAKFDPPSIVKILAGSGCLNVKWTMAQQQTWMKNYRLNLEIRLKLADSDQWPEQLVSTIPHHNNVPC